ncbi:MAG TPA: hypothetical protein VLB74_06680 [Flavobacterium sp.]|uniref:hypothetical protein n=1 Tax=Flavobacterium sp. TaxID=239 RepID=UPI002B720C96|nr:hypothetical protein [Flavobacterium sp.]HSD14315.1 hypothetical protein [Flavobacterium sp.]
MLNNKIIPFVTSLFKTNEKASKSYWAASFFFAMAIAAPLLNILFEFKPGIKDFSQHVISNTALNGLDISKRVSLFYKALLIIIFSSGAFFVFVNKVTDCAKNAQEGILKTLYSVSVIGIFAVFSGLLVVGIDFSVYILLAMVLFLIAEIRFNKLNQNGNLAVWPLLAAIPTAMLFYTFFKKHNFFEIIRPEFTVKTHVITTDSFLLAFVALLIPIALILNRIAQRHSSNPNALFSASIALILVPVVLSALLELSNVVNLRFGIVFDKPFYLFAFLLLLSFIAFFVLLKRFKNKISSVDSFEKYFIPLLLFGLLLMLAQPWRMISPENEFFETANHGLSIDHFFRYGSIPIVENFDAHMLHYQIFGFIYSFINGYEPWAPMLYTNYFYVLQVLVIFYVLRKVMGSLNSFVLVLSLPLISAVLNEFSLAGLLILIMLRLIRNKTDRNYYLFWFVAFFLCLYKLDVGFASILAGLLTYAILEYTINGKIEIKQLAKTGSIVGASLLAVFCLLCLIKGINPIGRLLEFLLAAKSDQNWGITRMGDMNHFLFRMSYYILPVLIAIIFVTVLVKFVFRKEKHQEYFAKKEFISAFAFFLFFALFFFFNAQRGIVRHNFEYDNIKKITSTIPFALIMLMFLINKKNRLVGALTVFFFSFLILNASKPDFKNKNSTLFKECINAGPFHEKFLPTEKFSNTRVRESFDQSEIRLFKKFLDLVLTPEQTYYDFSSKNYYHALTGRKNPSYLNQTPLMVNGDKGQDLEIETIKNANVTIILMPIKNIIWHAIDEVYTDFKYYKMSEYIYKNYTPLYRMASFDVYVIKNKQKEYLSKIKAAGFLESKTDFTDFSFFTTDAISKNSLQPVLNPDKSLTINATGGSPHFIGLMDYLKKQNQIKDSGLPTELSFSLNAMSQGNIKVYYKLTEAESFSETSVKEFPIANPGDTELKLSLPKTPVEIMFAINTSGIVLKKFSITNGSQSEMTKPEKIDYFAGFVPKLWAENSKETIFDKVQPLKEVAEETSASINAKNLNTFGQGCYAYLELESDSDMNGSIEIVSNDVSVASYGFSIVPGKHSYAIRMSNSYYWWNTTDPKISFKAGKAIKISKFSLILSDGSKEERFKGNGITLANLNDENWVKGCSVNYNMILFDYSPKREKLLSENKKIRLIDGRILNITGHYVSGNYINVTVSEKLSDYINALGYPNTIEFIK